MHTTQPRPAGTTLRRTAQPETGTGTGTGTGTAKATAPRNPAQPAAAQNSRGRDTIRSLCPLAIDIGIPLGTYYLLRDGLSASLWLSLAISSVGPAIRSVVGPARNHEL